MAAALKVFPCLSCALLACFLQASATEPSYTNSWAVEVRGGAEAADQLAQSHGFLNLGQVGNLRNFYHFMLVEGHGAAKRSIQPALIGSTPEKTRALQSEEHVGFVEQQLAIEQTKKSYVAPSDPNWSQQWSLLNTGQTHGPAGLDLNVEPAWLQGITGTGVVVGFVDDGLERHHPDLSPNFDFIASYDFAHYDSDPTPDYIYGTDSEEDNSHGTSCAGEVGMAKGNGHCGVGVAYNSKIAGLKVDLSSVTDLTIANALGHMSNHIQVYSSSWGPSDFGFVVAGPRTLTKRTFETGTTQGRNGKGSIFVRAAGNGGTYFDSCAADGYVSSIYTIAVGSADQNGGPADYDEECAAKMVTTFSYNSDTFPDVGETWHPYNQITTTTIHSQCTAGFTGTSASAPLVSGVIALALQANPDLTWRDVQYLIAYTSNRDSLTGGEWTTNGAGLRVSHKFGFGAIDAEAMVTRARHWISVPEQHSFSVRPTVSTSTAYDYRPITVTFQIHESSFSSQTRIHFLEHVVAQMSLTLHGYSTGYNYDDLYDYLDDYYNRDAESESPNDSDEEQEALRKLIEKAGHNSGRDLYDWLQSSHPRRGDIKIELTSPQGTKSVLLPYRNYDFVNEVGYNNWPFMSVHHWGENPVGTWTLKVSFKSFSGYVRLSNLNVTLYGTANTPEAVSSIPSQCDPACAGACSGPGPQNCDVCRHLRVNSTFECVSHCPVGTYSYKSYCICSSGSDCQTPTTSPTTSHTASTSATSTTVSSHSPDTNPTTPTTTPPTASHTDSTSSTTASSHPPDTNPTTHTTTPPTTSHTDSTSSTTASSHSPDTNPTTPPTTSHTERTAATTASSYPPDTNPTTHATTTPTTSHTESTSSTAASSHPPDTNPTTHTIPHSTDSTGGSSQNTGTSPSTGTGTSSHAPVVTDDQLTENDDNNDDKTSIIIGISAGIGSLLLIVGVTIAVACYFRKKKSRSQFTFIPLEEPTDSNTI